MPGIPFVCSYPVLSADLTDAGPSKLHKVKCGLCFGELKLDTFLMLFHVLRLLEAMLFSSVLFNGGQSLFRLNSQNEDK